MKMTKTKFQIKNRYTGKIIVEMEAETLKEVIEKNKADLQEANLREADLRGIDLQEANLQGANLWRANLQGANLWGAKIKITQKEDLIKSLGIVVKDEK